MSSALALVATCRYTDLHDYPELQWSTDLSKVQDWNYTTMNQTGVKLEPYTLYRVGYVLLSYLVRSGKVVGGLGKM